MKVYVVREHYEHVNNSERYENHYYNNRPIGIFKSYEGAKDFIKSAYGNPKTKVHIDFEKFQEYEKYLEDNAIITTCSQYVVDGVCVSLVFTTIEEFELHG